MKKINLKLFVWVVVFLITLMGVKSVYSAGAPCCSGNQLKNSDGTITVAPAATGGEAPTLTQVQTLINAVPLTSGHIFAGNSFNLPIDVGVTGDITLGAVGAFSVPFNINTGSVTTAKMAALSGTSQLIGSASGSTAATNITLGANLAMTGSVLNTTAKSQFSHVIFTPTTGSTITLTNNAYNAVNPAGAILALTVNFPLSPSDNDVVEIKYDKAVTTLTYGGGTFVGGTTSAVLGDYTKFTYDSGTSTWY